MKYLSYGSNINKDWMRSMSEDAFVVTTGVVKNARLVFRGRGYLNLEMNLNNGYEIPVVIWEVDEEMENMLDDYEDYPSLYEKEWIDVETECGTINAMVYLMEDDYKDIKCSPKEEYVKKVRDGYKDFSFDEIHIDRALLEL